MSTLRPLTKPDLQLAAPKSAGKPPKLEFLSLSKMRIDDSYQRRIERRGLSTIVRICNEFDWNRFAPLIVARVPGPEEVYSIIDGQHRATAALARGFDLVPCAIMSASALEQASIFAAVNGNVTPITILQLFKAARAAKVEWAVDVDRVCAGAGLKPLTYPKARNIIEPFETMAIGTLRKLIMRFGVAEVTAALAKAVHQPAAAEPGFWNSAAIDYAVSDWRTGQGKRQEALPAPAADLNQRIRDLKARGYSRVAIQAQLRVPYAVIEAAIGGAS